MLEQHIPLISDPEALEDESVLRGGGSLIRHLIGGLHAVAGNVLSLARRLRALDRSAFVTRFLHRNFLAREHGCKRVFSQGVVPVAKLTAVTQHAFAVDHHGRRRNTDPKDVGHRTPEGAIPLSRRSERC